MTILSKSGKVLYGSGDPQFTVSLTFWNALRRKRVRYRTGRYRSGVWMTEVRVLDIDADGFETVFKQLASSEMGRDLLSGRRSVPKIL